MKKTLQKTIALFAALAILMTLFVVPVSAAPDVQIDKTKSILVNDGTVPLGSIFGASSVSVTSSNKKIVTVKKVAEQFMPGTYSILITPKKTGTANIHVKVNGKKYICKVKVYAYSNPISSIKFNKTLISGSKFNKNTIYTMKYSKYANKTCPFTITLKKGWKLERVDYWKKGWMKTACLYGNDFDLKKQKEVFRNKKSVKVSSGSLGMLITAKNTKTGISQSITLELK